MKFDEDDLEDKAGGLPVIYMALGVSFFVLLVLMVVIAVNKDKQPSGNYQAIVEATRAAEESVAVDEVTPNVENTNLTADDLDIWDMYPVNGGYDDSIDPKEVGEDEKKDKEKKPTPTVSPEIDYNDGNHVMIKYADGSTEWVKINDKWEKNNYDFTNLIDSGGKMRYMSDGKTISFLGIDVSRYQKDIDFAQVKEQGIDFVMIRVGARGYKTGALSLDEFFEQNYTKATEAGLDVGLYFYSQAVTAAEATEEANLVLNAINGRKLQYPIAIDMEMVDNDISRIDTLSKDERTLITQTFVNKINEGGYKGLVYGNKEWLLKRVDVGKLTNCGMWLSQDDKVPDYPYLYDMWQYSTNGSVYGIDGAVDMNICFVDYSAQ